VNDADGYPLHLTGFDLRRSLWSPEYAQYHDAVVNACAELMGESVRPFFEEQCDYFEEFEEGIEPEEVAMAQFDAL
jgi:hypothetical protein